jgi:hypothetical protein
MSSTTSVIQMRTIELTQDQVAIVDDEDFDWLSLWIWSAGKDRTGNKFYATRTVEISPRPNRQFHIVKMHRLIMDAPDGVEVDHIDGNGLNNQRSNLRLATHQQNMCNQGLLSTNSSGWKGVRWHKQRQKWQARITVDGREIHLGLFGDPVEAAKRYDAAASEYFKDFARTNAALDLLGEPRLVVAA